MKSYIIILSVDCNTHLHTLSKKQKKIECYQYWQKQGRGRSPGAEKKQLFFERGQIVGRWCHIITPTLS